MAFKGSNDPPEPGSHLEENVFVLCIQTPYQQNKFRELGTNFIGIDATHNTTQYANMSLFTIIARDKWGHGPFLNFSYSTYQ